MYIIDKCAHLRETEHTFSWLPYSGMPELRISPHFRGFWIEMRWRGGGVTETNAHLLCAYIDILIAC